jgi:hypothetical protein
MFLPGGKYLYTHNRFPIRKSNAKLAPIEHIQPPEEGPSGVIFNDKKSKKIPLAEILKSSDLKNAKHYNVFYKNMRQTKKKVQLKKLEQSQSFVTKNNSLPDIKQNPVTATPKMYRLDDRLPKEQISRIDQSGAPTNPNTSINPENTLKILLSKQDNISNSPNQPLGDFVLEGKSEEIHETPRRLTHIAFQQNNENEPKPLNVLENSPISKTETAKETEKYLAKPLHGTHYAIKSPRSNRQDSIDNSPKLVISKSNILIRSMNFWNYRPDYVRELDGKLHFHNQAYVRKVEPNLYEV